MPRVRSDTVALKLKASRPEAAGRLASGEGCQEPCAKRRMEREHSARGRADANAGKERLYAERLCYESLLRYIY